MSDGKKYTEVDLSSEVIESYPVSSTDEDVFDPTIGRVYQLDARTVSSSDVLHAQVENVVHRALRHGSEGVAERLTGAFWARYAPEIGARLPVGELDFFRAEEIT